MTVDRRRDFMHSFARDSFFLRFSQSRRAPRSIVGIDFDYRSVRKLTAANFRKYVIMGRDSQNSQKVVENLRERSLVILICFESSEVPYESLGGHLVDG